MPTTKLKNTLYRMALPFLAPGVRSPALSQSGHDLAEKQAYIRLLRRHHVLGSALLISSEGQNAEVYSSCDRPARRAGAETMFRSASITKMMTALAALIYVERGILELDTPVSGYLKDLPPVPALNSVTLRHLLSHTSGLQDPADLDVKARNNAAYYDFLDACFVSPPGSSFRYSNLGFGLVGCILECVTVLSISEVLRKAVFEPLSLKAALDPLVLAGMDVMPVTRVFPYHAGADFLPSPSSLHPLSGPDPAHHFGYSAGGVYIQARSLCRFLQCLMNAGSPLLHTDLYHEAASDQAVYGSLSPTLSYGLGLQIIRDPSLSPSRILGHQGFAYGCVNGAFWEEDTGRVMIMLNGGCSELRKGRLALSNYDLLFWAFRKELPSWR